MTHPKAPLPEALADLTVNLSHLEHCIAREEHLRSVASNYRKMAEQDPGTRKAELFLAAATWQDKAECAIREAQNALESAARSMKVIANCARLEAESDRANATIHNPDHTA